MIVQYYASVLTSAGWRPELITARAESITEKRCKVVSVIDIGGNGATGYASRTGAKRQTYCLHRVAAREVGAVKLVSKLHAVEAEPCSGN